MDFFQFGKIKDKKYILQNFVCIFRIWKEEPTSVIIDPQNLQKAKI